MVVRHIREHTSNNKVKFFLPFKGLLDLKNYLNIVDREVFAGKIFRLLNFRIV
jgi:hypothetical protein